MFPCLRGITVRTKYALYINIFSVFSAYGFLPWSASTPRSLRSSLVDEMDMMSSYSRRPVASRSYMDDELPKYYNSLDRISGVLDKLEEGQESESLNGQETQVDKRPFQAFRLG